MVYKAGKEHETYTAVTIPNRFLKVMIVLFETVHTLCVTT